MKLQMRIYPKVKKLGQISNFIKKTKIIMTQFAIFLHTLIVGFMIFFMSVVSPIIFKTLNEENAGIFLRQLFPRMFLYGLIITSTAFLITLKNQIEIYWVISLISAIFFAINLFIITPKINQYRDDAKKGISLSEKRFKQFHFSSVTIFMLQLFGSLYLLIIFFY